MNANSLVTFGVASLFAFSGVLNAGEHMSSIGYIGNLSKMPFGFAYITFPAQKVGLYLDFKATLIGPSDGDTYDNISRNQAEVTWGDPLIGKDEKSICFDVGLAKRISPRLGFYGGLGYYKTQRFRRYYDSTGILGSKDKYWIEDTSKSGINITAGGLIFIARNVIGIVGFDTAPKGINLGISWMFETKAFKQFMDSMSGSH